MKFQKNTLFALLLIGVGSLGFVSCSDDDDNKIIDPEVPVSKTTGAYILDQGVYKTSTSALVYYDFETKKVSNAFKLANNIDLGDSGQDIIKYGSKTYVGMYGSHLIYVLDNDNKIISTIKSTDESTLQPRSFAAYGGSVYVTLYDGYLAKIDTTTFAIDKKIATGPNPEGVVVHNNKLVVANSGGLQAGYNKTISVVEPDLSSKTDITVDMNPCEVTVDKNNNLYVVARGNYGYGDVSVPGVIQSVNVTEKKATTLYSGNVYSAFAIADKVYILSKKYEGNTPTSTFVYYDAVTKKIVEQSPITDNTVIKDISYLAQDDQTQDFYILGANGTNNGDCYIFSSDGNLKSKFDTEGAYPSKILFKK